MRWTGLAPPASLFGRQGKAGIGLVELIRTDDTVLLSWLQARLAGEGIAVKVFDAHTCGVFTGVMDALASRVMVEEADLARARRVLAQAPAIADDR